MNSRARKTKSIENMKAQNIDLHQKNLAMKATIEELKREMQQLESDSKIIEN